MIELLGNVNGKAAIVRPTEPPANDARTGVSAYVARLQQSAARWRRGELVVSEELVEAALAVVPKVESKDPRTDEEANLFLFEYVDGFRGAQLMLNSIRRTAVALQIKGEPKPIATSFEERTEPHYPHFAYLLKAIETMMHTGRPSYPVERVLLTSGILDRALTLRAQKGKALNTPELAISYEPVDYPHAPRLDLLSPPPPP